jgi:hypothetical protein
MILCASTFIMHLRVLRVLLQHIKAFVSELLDFIWLLDQQTFGMSVLHGFVVQANIRPLNGGITVAKRNV